MRHGLRQNNCDGGDPAAHTRTGAVARSAAAGVVALGLLVQLGWAFDVELFKSFLHPARVAMNPATSVGFILCGLSLWLLAGSPTDGSRPRGRLAGALAAAAVALAGAKLAGYVPALRVGPGVDRLLYAGKLGANVMAPNTAILFLLVGTGLATLDLRAAWLRASPAAALAASAGCVALLSLIGYLYQINSLYQVGGYIPMALNTSLGFAALACGMMAARPEREPVATLCADSMGGRVFRRLLPTALGVPLLAGWLRLQGQRWGLYDTAFGAAIFTVFTVVGFTAIAWWAARYLHRADLRNRDLMDQLEHKAQVDGLTGLWNRTHFDANLAAEAARSGRHGRPFCCVMLDVDHFKSINDRHGHGFGDEVLRAVAAALRRACRLEDSVYRYGGEEFVVILPETPAAGAERVAERLRETVQGLSLHHGGRPVPVTCSLGVAEAGRHDSGSAGVVETADAALYRAKRGGRNRVEVATGDPHASAA